MQADFGQRFANFGRHHPKSPRSESGLSKLNTNLVDTVPNAVGPGPHVVGVDMGLPPSSANFTDLNRSWPDLGRLCAGFAKCWAVLAEFGLDPADPGFHSTSLWSTSTDIEPMPAGCGRDIASEDWTGSKTDWEGRLMTGPKPGTWVVSDSGPDTGGWCIDTNKRRGL